MHSPPVHPGSDSVSSSFSVLISGFLSSSVIVLVSTISTKRFPLRSPVMLWAILKSRASRADDFLVTRPLKLEHICDWPGVEIKLTRYCDWLSAALQSSCANKEHQTNYSQSGGANSHSVGRYGPHIMIVIFVAQNNLKRSRNFCPSPWILPNSFLFSKTKIILVSLCRS